MRSSIDDKATAIVSEMASLGATFRIADIGPGGEPRWTWEPHPEVMRNAIRRVWVTATDRYSPGFSAAMIGAIRRHHAGLKSSTDRSARQA